MRHNLLLFSLSVFLFTYIQKIHAQENLIANPGFENSKGSHPDKFANDNKINNSFISGWTHPGPGCPDYWDTTATCFPDPDYDYVEYDPLRAHSGKGTVGIALHVAAYDDDDWDDYTDYIQTELIHPLKKDSSYYLEFYVRIDPSSSYITDNIGAYFSTNAVTESSSRDRINQKPQVFLSRVSSLSSSGWAKVSGSFVATDNFKYMTVGAFDFCSFSFNYHKLHPDRVTYYDNHKVSTLLYLMAYYYVDDFLLIPQSAKAHQESVQANHVILLVDVSKSMYDGKYIDTLKNDLKNFIVEKGATTKITLITFGSGVQVKSVGAFFTDEKIIDSLLNTFSDGSATNIEKAIDAGYALADSLYDPDYPTDVVLFSDAGFVLSKQAAKKIKTHVKEKHINFIVYHYGKHENKAFEKSVAKWDAIYASASSHQLADLVKPKESHPGDCD